ncbi:hypothetical protein D3C75_1077970 [compost metagenome]
MSTSNVVTSSTVFTAVAVYGRSAIVTFAIDTVPTVFLVFIVTVNLPLTAAAPPSKSAVEPVSPEAGRVPAVVLVLTIALNGSTVVDSLIASTTSAMLIP